MKHVQSIALFGWAMAVWLPDASALEAGTPVVGYLYVGAAAPSAHLLAEFWKGLANPAAASSRYRLNTYSIEVVVRFFSSGAF
jgi:hypothetical protein